ncbi:MAG TPA: transketolase [Candidatus Methanoperedens sp.]|nr:transketolase [Candidatus Methanoperedens sp.]
MASKNSWGTAIRKIVLDESRRANVGHIGSSLSVADILGALYARVLRIPSPAHPERDRFVLSKGHAALALYAALVLRGFLEPEILCTYCGDDTHLGVHPERGLPGVDFATGSLGMGASFATGAALAAKLDGSGRRVFALLSDAELNEGVVWEAAMFAAHHRLDNLVFILDLNGQQAFGYTKDVIDLAPVAAWRAFGWDVLEHDGHDEPGLADALLGFDFAGGRPHVLAATTVFGKGVSFMERQIKWHYWPLSEEEHRQALAEIGA